jgi:hypothetical protein
MKSKILLSVFAVLILASPVFAGSKKPAASASSNSEPVWTVNGQPSGPAGPWGLSLRMGPAIPTQNFNSSAGGISGETGFMLNPQVIYDLTPHISVGFDFTWENHNVNAGAFNIGTVNTYSLMGLGQYRFLSSKALRPYGALAVGANINTFDVNPFFSPATLTPANSFAIQPSVGLDWFLWRSLAVNAEIGWKWNAGNLTTNIPGVSGTFNASSVVIFLGGKYYF